MSNRVLLLGVPLDPVTEESAVDRILAFLASPAQHHVMTPNAEMLVEAQCNQAFHQLLQRTSLNLPDSVSLLWAARRTGQHLPARVTGVDTVVRLCGVLGPEHPVFLLGSAPGVAERAAAELSRRNPRLVIAGTYAGSPREEHVNDVISRISAARPHLLLVAYGAPAQDLWIDRHLSALPSVRVAMGIGGTFDFLAGTVKRAPQLLRRLGLEWLWRLVREPWRWRRIVRATIVFPWLVVRSQPPVVTGAVDEEA